MKFTVSGRSYLITDWVTATELATVYETPNAEDTGAWTIRRTLYTDDFNVANPVRNAANGRLYQKWINSGANSQAAIFAAAPNGVDDGGAELNSLTDYWTASTSGGSTGAVTVNSSSAILGTYDFKFDKGDRTSIRIAQPGKIDLRTGYTYGIICKGRVVSGTSSLLLTQLLYVAYGDAAHIPLTFTKINGGDTLSDGGNGTNNVWQPAFTTDDLWKEATFTVPSSVEAGDWKLDLYLATETDDIFIDEIYLWEIGPTALGALPNPDTVTIAGHNMAGGFTNASDIGGQRCHVDLTWYSPSNDRERYLDLDADVQVDGNAPVYETWTATTAIYPITRVQFAAVSGKTWEAAEIWVGKRWTWEKYPNSPLTGKQRKIESTSAKARGGPVQSDKIYQQTIISSTQDLVDSSEVDVWVDFIETSGHGKPFWLRVQTAAGLGVTAHTIFCRCASVPDIQEDPPVYYTASFSFEEAF